MFTVTTAPHSFPPLTLKYRKFTIRSFTKPFLREPVYNRDLSKEREPGWGGGGIPMQITDLRRFLSS